MGWFSKRSNEDPGGAKPPEPRLVSWSSNAPLHWPPLCTQPLPFPDPKTVAEASVNTLAFAANLGRAFDAVPGSCKLAAVAQSRLLPDGILEVPIEVEDGASRRAVFAYPSVNEESSAHFAAVAAILRSRGEPEPVYFAPSTLPPAEPSLELPPLEPAHLSRLQKAPPGRYAMWWLAPDHPVFDRSPTIGHLRAWYEALEGIYSYAMAIFAKQLDMVDGEAAAAARIALPENDFCAAAKGPENRTVLVSFSREKGIQFKFDAESCPPGYRDVFWKLFVEFARHLREQVSRHGLPLDPPDPAYDRPGWLRLVEKSVALSREQGGGETQLVGVTIMEESGRPDA
jgi:hypothetical protein